MNRSSLEVADIFRDHGLQWREAHAGHVSQDQLKAMSAIERCRSAALGGHVLRCQDCGTEEIAYNSCRNRHCPKCQSQAAKRWLSAREQDLLPVEYYHVVFTLPTAIGDIALQNKAVVYSLLFKATAETLRTIALDPRHLGAEIGFTAVLHTWGSAMTHHPHLHCIVPGGGLSASGDEWVPCKAGFFLPVRVLSKLFRRLFLEQLYAAYQRNELAFYGSLQTLSDEKAFADYLAPLRQRDWFVYAKRPFAGPKAVLNYLSRYTHRVAISNRRLIACDDEYVTFKWKDYRAKAAKCHKTMRLAIDAFIYRFLLHILPSGFHRIRHYGLLANHGRRTKLQRLRELLGDEGTAITMRDGGTTEVSESPVSTYICPNCSGAMVIIATLQRMPWARAPP
jgi:Zn finger protein HypA/HybF involved in hydrogenase expression